MAFRFSNTDKWKDSWFSELKPLQKLLFIYFCDNCDIAGFIEYMPKRWAFDLQSRESDIIGAIEGLNRGLIISNDKTVFYVRTFLKNQKNLPLNEKNNAHLGIIKCFNNYAHLFDIKDINEFILGANKGLVSPIGKGNDIDKDKSNDKEEEKTWRNDYNIYHALVQKAYEEIVNDSKKMEELANYYPKVNIKLSLIKACKTFWATDEGWKNKKSKQSKEINMKSTLIKALSFPNNKVYLT